MKFKHVKEIWDVVRETSFAIHGYHRHGHLEKIYENALTHRWRKVGVVVEQQHPIKALDEAGTLPGDFAADLFIENQLVVELKAVRAVVDEHIAQIPGYLRSSRLETGRLINFGAPVLPVKKYLMTDQPVQFDGNF